ncbi:Type 1 glutamine amidotransferase-like domain-containing protein [Haploplasma axanthum]|nr:Type 1 glutamine amidotransferase-like domain-containing protein [Haploplasma axanthum]
MVNVLISRTSIISTPWAIRELEKYFRKDMKVVVLAFSFFGNLTEEEYFNEYGIDSIQDIKVRNTFELFGIKDVKWIYYYKQSNKEAINLINNADILYLPGGAPDLMMERINEKGLLSSLKNFKNIVVGSSAGAMIQLERYHISKDNEYNKFAIHEGLEYINDFFIEVHFRNRKKQKSSMRRMRKEFKKPVYIIPDDGMIIVDDKKIKTINSAKKYYDRKGIIKVIK